MENVVICFICPLSSFLPIVYMWWAQVQSCLLPFPKDHQPLTCCLKYIIISTCFINNLKTPPLLGPTAALVSYLIFAYNIVLYIILTNHITIFYKNLFWSFILQSTSFNNQTTSSLTTLSCTSLTVFINWPTL